jgi:hypothetical protein
MGWSDHDLSLMLVRSVIDCSDEGSRVARSDGLIDEQREDECLVKY